MRHGSLVLAAVALAMTLAGLGVLAPWIAGPNHPGWTLYLRQAGALGALGLAVLLFSRATRGMFAPTPEPDAPPPARDGPLEMRIEAAVETAKARSRTIGVIYGKAAIYDDVRLRLGEEAAQEMMEGAAAALRAHLRAHDMVDLVGDGAFVVTVGLLRKHAHIAAIGRSVRRVLADYFAPYAGGGKAAVTMGASIYPMGGYAGADLIARARSANGRSPNAL